MTDKPEPTIDIRTAHDVRRLRKCAFCGGMGDSKYMPFAAYPGNHGTELMGHLHGFCAMKVLGVAGILKLPMDEINKLSLGEIGPAAMTAICNATSPPKKRKRTHAAAQGGE